MKKGCKIALVGGLAAVVGIAACWKWMIRMPLGEFTRYALYMAVLDAGSSSRRSPTWSSGSGSPGSMRANQGNIWRWSLPTRAAGESRFPG